MTTTVRFPVGGERQAVYDHMRSLGFVMSDWSDKAWKRADGVEAHIFGAGSMVRVGKVPGWLAESSEFPLEELHLRLANR